MYLQVSVLSSKTISMRFSCFVFALVALTASASLIDDFHAILLSAGDLLGPGKPSFSAAVSDIMQNPLVIRVFDDLSVSDRTSEINQQLVDHVHEALVALFGTANTTELVSEFAKSSSFKFSDAQVNQIIMKAHQLIGNHLDWVVPALLDDDKLQDKTAEFQETVQVIMDENEQRPMELSDENEGFMGLVSKLSPEALAQASAAKAASFWDEGFDSVPQATLTSQPQASKVGKVSPSLSSVALSILLLLLLVL